MIDGPGGIRVYNLPVERIVKTTYKDSDNEEVVDDWEQLAANVSTPSPTEIFIPDCDDLEFNLLKGYIPMDKGGNQVGFCGKNRDRTAGIRFMVEHYQKLKCVNGKRLFDIDFFAGNGAIRSIMTSQFSSYEEVAYIAVTFFKGTYFMFKYEPTDTQESELNNKRSFGGLRFEDFISRGTEGEESGPSNGEQNNYLDSTKYYNVVRLNFDIFKMLIAGEVDCVIPGSNTANGRTPRAADFIEVKTSAPLEDKYDNSRMSRMFRCGKISSWFAQCILMGVKHVVVGIRDEVGETMTCTRTHAFTVEDLRKNSNGSWSKNRCFDDLKKFLCIVKEKVIEDNPEIINVFLVKNGSIGEPERKKVSDDPDNLPDLSEVALLMKKLQQYPMQKC